MQSYRENSDKLDLGASHNVVNSDNLNDRAKHEKEAWISEMPPHIKEKAEEWVDYFSRCHFKDHFPFSSKRKMFLNLPLKRGLLDRLRLSNAPKLLWLLITVLCLTLMSLAFNFDLKWIFILITVVFFIFMIYYSKRVVKLEVKNVPDSIFSENSFDHHKVKMRMLKADDLKDSGEYERAIEIYYDITEKHKYAWNARLQLCSCLLLLGQSADAEIEYNNLIDDLNSEPYFKEKYNLLAMAYNQLGNMYEKRLLYSEAYKYFKKAYRSYSEYWIIHSNLLYICIKLRKLEEAKSWFLRLNDKNRELIMDLLNYEDLIYLQSQSWFKNQQS